MSKFYQPDSGVRIYHINSIPVPDYYESSFTFQDFDWSRVPSDQFFGKL